jgi:hypothetical protein
MEGYESLPVPRQLVDEPVVLLNDVVQAFNL